MTTLDRFSSASLSEDAAWNDISRAEQSGSTVTTLTAQYIMNRFNVKTARGVANALGRLDAQCGGSFSPTQETRYHMLRALQAFLNATQETAR